MLMALHINFYVFNICGSVHYAV